MRIADLSTWIATARGHGAVILEVRRARKNGSTPKGQLFAEEPLASLDVERFAQRLREDVLSRRLVRAMFELAAKKQDDLVMHDRVEVLRDENGDGEDVVQEAELAWPKVVASATESAARAHELVRSMARENAEEFRKVIGDVTQRLVDLEGKHQEVLSTAFEFATLKFEREKEQQRSEENRALAKTALTELAPIGAAVLAKVSDKMGPAVVGLLRSLTEDQLQGLFKLLKPEQMGLVSILSELTASPTDKEEAAKEAEKKNGAS